MTSRTQTILRAAMLAVCGVCAPLAMAADSGGSAREGAPAGQPSNGPTSLAPASADPVMLPGRRPFMGVLDSFGLAKPFDDAGIQVYGHAEGSYTYNFAGPPTDLADYKLPVGKFIDNPGRVFDVENQKILLNQLTLNFEKRVDASKGRFDVGGRVELMYGADARFIHANGMFDHHDDDTTVRVTGGPQNHFDIPNAYFDIAIPDVGNGLTVRAGKFTFFKQIDPNYSPFYSHSFTFGGALPFTLTGAYGTYVINDQWTVDAGASRGWDQAFEDNNGAIDGFGRVRYTASEFVRFVLAGITGPEQAGDNSNWRTAINLTAAWEPSDTTTFLADFVYGQQAQPTGGGGTAHWYGVSLYAIQELTKELTAGVRLEWYRDDGGYTTGLDQNLYEATVGLTIKPFPNDKYLQYLKIRPEVRLDYSDEKYFDGFDSYMQVTAAIDAIYNF